jgi:isobutyryl-CoA mutase
VADQPALHVPANPVRVVTAASLFDGHDAAINIMRRLLQSQGAEVIHLGHDRSVAEVVTAAVQEDAQAVAVSSYQGGHVEYFTYLVESLRERGAGHVQVYGGGGGVIVPSEIALLHERGVARIFSPEDGQRLGLPGMINTIIRAADVDLSRQDADVAAVAAGDERALARAVTQLQAGVVPAGLDTRRDPRVPVLGITGTGGAGKSSLTDELVRRFRRDHQDKLRIAVLAIDPTRRRGRGALLGDRIRMNTIEPGVVWFRSLATRAPGAEVPEHLDAIIGTCTTAGFDLVIVETPGIGQGDAAITEFADVSLYVMTPEFGAASQLEKIDMLDLADVVAINKFERRGAEDALRDVSRQLVRNRQAFGTPWQEMPVFGTSAARFDDDGVTALYQEVSARLRAHVEGAGGTLPEAGALPRVDVRASSGLSTTIPPGRERYLAEIAEERRATADDRPTGDVEVLLADAEAALSPETRRLLEGWPALVESYSGDEIAFEVRGRTITAPATRETLSGTQLRRVSLPRYEGEADLYRFLRREHLPGRFPFTAGVFPLKREGEAPARMFAGEGDPFRTNRRFHLLAEGQPATRLSTAFDSVTLYGRDPEERPDVYGKVGTSGVSIATLDDVRELYRGFDLCDPSTSVSMTINGPAPTILAFYLNAAVDQQVDRFREAEGREPSEEELQAIRARTFSSVRGTVQADILKEDQGQNTCIFSTEFSLRCMADIQEWFVRNDVRNFYSVSISGYHIAEAGANPITQLAFTLANGFTYVEAYLARGMAVDDFAPNLSFFFSNGMDAEYTVIGRVARRIWAIAMRDRYGAGERSQKLKYHVQTSGRSLHAQEMHFNDIRTTLQALCAIYDHTNSLHTNAYDEAVTTPTAESVRRALAIQMIIDQEWGLAKNENPLQGSYVVEELTDLVEEAVLREFERLSDRGGVLGAMETGYQRGKIQDESLLYEHRKHDGSLPIIGVNTFLPPAGEAEALPEVELARATDEEKAGQLRRTREFRAAHAGQAEAALARLQEVATSGGNTFDALMQAARVCTLGQITEAFFEVGGQYRRSV